MSILGDPRFIPRTSREGWYPIFYGEHLTSAKSVVDFGAGDNDYWRIAEENGQRFMRVDAKYDTTPPQGGNFITADARTTIEELEEESFDVSIASYLLQHVSAEEMVAMLSEMARVTRTTETAAAVGKILVFPVWRPRFLQRLVDDFPHIVESRYATPVSVDSRAYEYKTLVLNKTDDSIDKLPEIIEGVVASGALKPDLLSRTISGADKLLTRVGFRSTLRSY